MSWRSKHKSFAFAALVFVSLVMGFQNCSQQYGVGVNQAPLSGFSSKKYQYEEVDLSQRSTYPPLKMIFVVDNSDTMRLNQVNLAQSFSAMFDGSSAGNLTPFEAQFFVINTAQASGDIVPSTVRETKFPLWGGGEIPLSQKTFQEFNNLNRSRDLSGLIAGDIIGFRTLREQVGAIRRTSYTPSPVLGLSDSGRGLALTQLGIRKAANESADRIKAEFSSRVGILDPNRNLGLNPQIKENKTLSEITITTYGEFDSVIDNESGLCALARVLESPQGFINSGDLVSYVIISDEDESHPSGSQCVSRREEVPKGDLINAECMVKTGIFRNKLKYELDVPAHYRTLLTQQETVPGSCSISFINGLNVNFRHQTTSWVTKVSYTVQKNSQTCYSRQTNVTYHTESHVCIERDRVRTCSKRYSLPITAPFPGDFSASKGLCTASALKGVLPANAVLNSADYPFSCEQDARRITAVGTTSDCEANPTVFEAKQKTLNGDYSIASLGCNQSLLAPILDSGTIFNNPEFPVVCDQQPTKVVTPQSPQTMTVNLSDVGRLGISSDLADNSSCPASLIQDRLSQFDLLSCTVSWRRSNLAQNFEQGQSCLNLAADYCVKNSASVRNCSGVEISSPRVASIDSTVTAKDPVTCDSSCVGTSLCHASGSKSIQQHLKDSIPRFIQGSCNVKSAGVLVAAKVEHVEENRDEKSALSCSSNCSLGGFCGTPAPQASIESYLTSRFDGLKENFPPVQKKYRSGTCQMVAQEKEEAKTFTHLAENFDIQKACPANAVLIPRNGNPSGPFTNPDKVESIYFVSGGTQTPKSDLTSYIRGRSAELLGEVLPVVSVFVRQPEDSTGQGGSVGTVYNSLADLFGGSKNSIYSKDYSPAFARMGEKVKQRLERSIVLPQLTPDHTVSRIWRRTQGQSVWTEPLKPEMWSRSGNTIFFSEDFPLTGSDSFRIEYY